MEKLEIKKRDNTTFIATCMKGYHDQLLLHIPGDVTRYLELEKREKVEITIKKTGMMNTRKIPPNPFGKAKQVRDEAK